MSVARIFVCVKPTNGGKVGHPSKLRPQNQKLVYDTDKRSQFTVDLTHFVGCIGGKHLSTVSYIQCMLG